MVIEFSWGIDAKKWEDIHDETFCCHLKLDKSDENNACLGQNPAVTGEWIKTKTTSVILKASLLDKMFECSSKYLE